MAKIIRKTITNVTKIGLESFAGDVLAIGFYKGDEKTNKISLPKEYAGLDKAVACAISKCLELGDFKGGANEVSTLYLPGGLKFSRLLLVGLGDEKDVTVNTFRKAAGSAARAAARLKVSSLGLALASAAAVKLDAREFAQATAEGAIYGNYRFEDCFSEKNNWSILKLTLIASDADKIASLKKGFAEGTIIADAQNYARSLTNKPGNEINPPILAKEGKRLAKEFGISCMVLDEKQLAAKKMNAILAVGGGSSAKPRLVMFEYDGRKNAKKSKAFTKSNPDVLIVGKGVTFDSGGLDIKPITGMQTMKCDKAGACNVFGVMAAVAQLKLPIHVVAFTPLVENFISSTAYRPDDVIKTYSGKTVEITSTDAEGRLIMADALAFGAELKPKAMMDIATLTGGIVVALGSEYAGLFGNDDKLLADLNAVAADSGEQVWIMPSGAGYLEQMKSKIADLKNTGGREGAACTAAAFLKEFVGDTPWAHIDIAALDTAENEKAWQGVGATGYGVRMIMNYLRSL